jgi:hypothetical protein
MKLAISQGFHGRDWNTWEREIIDAAIRFSYPDIYSNMQELQVDYSKFKPISNVGGWAWKR